MSRVTPEDRQAIIGSVAEQPEPVPVRYVVTPHPRRVNHVLHLLLSLVTCGLWLPVWLIVAIVAALSPEERRVSSVYAAPPMAAPAAAPAPAVIGPAEKVVWLVLAVGALVWAIVTWQFWAWGCAALVAFALFVRARAAR